MTIQVLNEELIPVFDPRRGTRVVMNRRKGHVYQANSLMSIIHIVYLCKALKHSYIKNIF